MKNLTTSIYTFENLIDGGWLYVDKTEFLWELLKYPQGIYFLSRPRRFGKSLTLSTLKAVFQNKRRLFKGLALDGKPYDWKEYPIIHLDMGKCPSETSAELASGLSAMLGRVAADYGISLPPNGASLEFLNLIETLGERGKVVILIDEYDKPILDNVLRPEIEGIRRALENFYSVIKATESCQRFVLMTGVSKFSKVSVFSKLNNLRDITMDAGFAAMLGYTQEELEANFAEYIDRTVKTQRVEREALLDKVKLWYNGYRFREDAATVYNPVSVAKFFESGGKFSNYWFATGTPSFLLKLVKEHRFDFEEALTQPVAELAFDSYEIDKLQPLPLLFQTGYLTIRDTVETLGVLFYRLDFPNREVSAAFEAYLLDDYAGVAKERVETHIVEMAKMAMSGDTDGLMVRLKVFFANVPYDIQLKDEKYYQTIFYVVFRLLGLFVEAEARTSRGRIDAVVQTEKRIYVFEFKLDGTADAALAQIREKEYRQRYLGRGKRIILVGAAFDSATRNIGEWKTETIDGETR